MIVFDLHCEKGHRFEGWFGSSSDFEDQSARGLIECPECGVTKVSKAPMAPAVPAKGNTAAERALVPTKQAGQQQADAQPVSSTPLPAEVKEALAALGEAQEKALKNSTYVGKDFVEQSREMHYGERDEAPIHGQASLEEAQSLMEEGVPVAPLPFPVAPPDKLN